LGELPDSAFASASRYECGNADYSDGAGSVFCARVRYKHLFFSVFGRGACRFSTLHPIFVAHYNEFSQIAARQQHAFVAVVPDARMGKSEWGEVEYEAFFFAPAQDTEEFEVQLDRIAGVRASLMELWPKMVSFTEIIPKFSRRAEWGTGEKLVKGEWIAIRLTINLKDYELNAV
jgi:hypothetical protein